MKTLKIITVAISLIAITVSSIHAELGRTSRKHLFFGAGMVVDNLPVATADMKLPITHFAYDYSFMDPDKKLRTSIEIGLYGFYGILPVPEIGANLYIGSEENDIQGKIGLGGFYDISVGGHAGIAIKPGIVIKNMFEISLLCVPVGSDAKQSYKEFFGFESEEEAAKTAAKNGGQNVVMPYYGFLLGFRF